MSSFDPAKLSVDYKNGISIRNLEIPRRYTLTHSDETGELFLSIGKEYDYDKVGPMRDEVLGNWVDDGNNKILEIFVQVDGNKGLVETIIRDKIFRKELPLALTAIIYGDGLLYEANAELKDTPIKVHFNSEIPEYNVVEEWGKIKDYKYAAVRPDNITVKQGLYQEPYPLYPYPPTYPSVPWPIQNKPIKTGIKKYNIVEKALIIMLEPYIENQVKSLFGKRMPYCLKKADILYASTVSPYSECTEEYEITVGLKVGKNPPHYNNLIISFLINENVVKVTDVKTPK